MAGLWTGEFGVSDEPATFEISKPEATNLRGLMILGIVGIGAYSILWALGRNR